MKRLAVVVLGVLTTAVGCAGNVQVVRVMDGDEIVGRFVDEQAYEAYLQGEILEQEGNLQGAEQAYQQAHEADPDGVAPLVRLGAVRCGRGSGLVQSAQEAFRLAAEIDGAYGPLFIERARCELARGDVAGAERDARRALWLDARDEEASLILARAFEAGGHVPEAIQVLLGYAVWRPQAAGVWRALLACAERHHDTFHQKMARERLQQFSSVAAVTISRRQQLAMIDRAIASGDMPRARSLAIETSVGAGTLGVRAAALGRWDETLDQVSLALGADPSDADAVAALVSIPDSTKARARFGEHRWQQLMTHPVSSKPSPLAALVLADALVRRGSVEAARGLLRAQGPLGSEPDDGLYEMLRKRQSSEP